MDSGNKTPWYVNGLRFACKQCGDCCCGPREGYIWVRQEEIESIAEKLNISVEQMLQKYCRRVEHLISLLERKDNKDCIFLRSENGHRVCSIYNVRPSQCRRWPFWKENLKTSDSWNKAAENCPGMNNGYLYSFGEIQNFIAENK